MNSIHCNHIRIGAFIAENEEPPALSADIGATRSVIGKKQMKRILDMTCRRYIPAIRSKRVFAYVIYHLSC